MKTIILILSAYVCIAAAGVLENPNSIQLENLPPNQTPFFRILRYSSNNNGDGAYQFEYETENKINQAESGFLKNIGTDSESNVVHGSYSYVAPDGQIIKVDYVADENGFQAAGPHLPTPPPIPAEIQESLLKINQNTNVQYLPPQLHKQ